MSKTKKFGKVYGMLNEKCVEPIKRNKDGVRWIVHRYPIKGGISLREAWIRDMCQPNTYLQRLKVIDG